MYSDILPDFLCCARRGCEEDDWPGQLKTLIL